MAQFLKQGASSLVQGGHISESTNVAPPVMRAPPSSSLTRYCFCPSLFWTAASMVPVVPFVATTLGLSSRVPFRNVTAHPIWRVADAPMHVLAFFCTAPVGLHERRFLSCSSYAAAPLWPPGISPTRLLVRRPAGGSHHVAISPYQRCDHVTMYGHLLHRLSP